MKKKIFLGIILLTIIIPASPQIFYKNSGTSISTGKVQSGSLKNGYLLPRKGDNFKFCSGFSYYILGRGYVHSSVYNSIVNSYGTLKSQCPHVKFWVGESSKKHGGKMPPHRTHQNGTSVDFMTPLLKKGKPFKGYNFLGIYRYLLNCNSNGYVTNKVTVDFETIAKHILALDVEARKQGLYVKKVIMKVDIQDNLFATPTGKKLKARGIYFTPYLSPQLNKLHDDHYHIDFGLL